MKYDDFFEEKEYLIALSDLFKAIRSLCKYYRLDQAIEIMELYMKSNNATYLTMGDNIRGFVTQSNIRNLIYPVIVQDYDGLHDFFNQMINRKNSSK